MSNISIVSAKSVELLKQRARDLKRSEGITHHLALERIAQSIKFCNWHQVTVAASETKLAETAQRSGLIVGLDIKDASEAAFDRDGTFIEDPRLWHFCKDQLFRNYLSAEDDEGRTFASMAPEEELLEEFEMSCDTILYRYCPIALPATLDEVWAMSRERCFFAPRYVWWRGEFIDVFDYLSEDGNMMVW